jgi:hypothetical protein
MTAEQDAKDIQKEKDSEQRGQREAQQQFDAAVKIGRMCPERFSPAVEIPFR